jgi:hypothetical protein
MSPHFLKLQRPCGLKQKFFCFPGFPPLALKKERPSTLVAEGCNTVRSEPFAYP